MPAVAAAPGPDALAAEVRPGLTASLAAELAGYAGAVSTPLRPAPPPLEGDDRVITAVITAAWVVALIVLLIVRTDLAPADRWWVWVAVGGVGLGLFGLIYVPYLKRSRASVASRRAERSGPPV
jgi:hypothetical protein